MNYLLFIGIKFNYKSQFNQVNKNQNESILKETLQFLIEILFKMHDFFPRYMNLIQNHGGPNRDFFFSRTRYCPVMLYDQLLVTDSRVKLIMGDSFKCAPSLSFAHTHWNRTLLTIILAIHWKHDGKSMIIVTVVTLGSLVAGELHIALEAPPTMCCGSKNLFFLFLSWCVYMYMYSCVREHIGVHIHAHASEGQSLTLNVSLDDSPPYLLR